MVIEILWDIVDFVGFGDKATNFIIFYDHIIQVMNGLHMTNYHTMTLNMKGQAMLSNNCVWTFDVHSQYASIAGTGIFIATDRECFVYGLSQW